MIVEGRQLEAMEERRRQDRLDRFSRASALLSHPLLYLALRRMGMSPRWTSTPSARAASSPRPKSRGATIVLVGSLACMLIAIAVGLALIGEGDSRLGGAVLLWGVVGSLAAQGPIVLFVAFKVSRQR